MGILNTRLLDSVATSFDGEVYRTKVDDLDTMFLSNIECFSDTGIQSFFKTCGIPKPPFFLEKPVEYIKETFINQKSHIRDKGDILLLVRDNTIVYASNDSGVVQEDPTVKFDLTGWSMVGEDLTRGFRRYVYAPNEFIKDSFVSTSFINVPIMYSSKMAVEVGLFRVLCSNGMLAQVETSNQLKIPKETFDNHLFFEPFMSGILSGLIESGDAYSGFLKYLNEKELPDISRLRDKLQVLTEDKIISKTVSLFSSRHLDIIEKGEAISDETLPDSMGNLMDFTNLLTRFAQESKTLSQQVKIEKQVFDYMHSQYKEDVKKEVVPLNLEDLMDSLLARTPDLLEGARA